MKENELYRLDKKAEYAGKKYTESADQYFYADFSCNSRKSQPISDWKILDKIVNLREEKERLEQEFNKAIATYYEI